MKKIRLLALLLVLLMLPLSLFIACDNDTDPGVDEPGTEDPDDKPGDTTTPGGDEDEDEVYDNDGTASGYLMFFNFDAAGRGDLRADSKPYSSYLTIADDVDGVSYIVTNDFAKSGNSLLIQREGSQAAASLEIGLASISGLTSSHTVEFDIKVGDGYITDDMVFSGTKFSGTNNFVKFTSKGVFDNSGNMLYEYKAEDDWLAVAIAINDAERVFNVYVNGAKLTNDISYATNAIYKKWEEEKPTAYKLGSGTARKDFYIHIDNLGIIDGVEPTVRVPANDDITYTDSITDKFLYMDYGDKATYFDALEKTYATKVKQNPYDEGFLLSDTYGVYRVNMDTDKIAPIVFDYGVELGKYVYGADLANKLFKVDDNNYFFFKSNSALEFVGKRDGKDVAGTYVLDGGDTAPEAKLVYTLDGAEETLYAKIDVAAGTITVSTSEDYTVNPVVYTVDATTPLSAFNGKLYGYTISNQRVTIAIYEAIGKADLYIESPEGVTAELKNVAYTYANNVVTIVDGETTYAFTYTADDADGTFAYGEQTFGLFDAWQVMDCEKLCSYFGSYQSMGGSWAYTRPDFKDTFDPNAWRKLKIRYFLPEDKLGFSVGLYIDCGNNEGGICYWMTYANKTVAGWHEVELDLATAGGTRTPSLERLTGRFQLTYSGWNSNIGAISAGKDGVAADGYGIIIGDVYFYENRVAAVEGPAADKLDCTHTGDDGASLFVDGGVVASSCTAVGYTALKCTNCGATKVDASKPVVPAGGHTTDDTVAAVTVAPSCETAGYAYKMCTVCNEQVIVETIEAPGHDNYSYYDSSASMMKLTCKVCGTKSEYAFIEVLLTGQEKRDSKEFNAFDKKYSFGVWADHNIGNVTSGTNFATKMDGNKATGGMFDNGEYYWSFARESTTTVADAFFQFVPSDAMGIGVDFVYEFDVMLGEKAADGKYLIMAAFAKDRKHYGNGAQYGKDIQLFQFPGDGTIVFKEKGSNNPNLTVQLSEEEYTNIAMAISPANNTINIYVNGYLTFADVVAVNDDLSQFTLDCLRTACAGTNQKNETTSKASMFFNNFMLYPASQPICVLTNTGSVVKEYAGDIALETAPKTPAGSAVSVAGTDVELSMPQYVVSTKYVLDFKLTAAALANGAILSGTKLDEYRFENKLDLITVKGEYIYFLDTVICKVSDAAAGVNITLEADDKAGSTVVYVNGEAVPGGAIKYTADHGYYGASGSYITSFTFGSAVGAYEITELEMYTGTIKTAE